MTRQEFDGAQMNARAVSRVQWATAAAADDQGQHFISESQAARERGKQMGAGGSCAGGQPVGTIAVQADERGGRAMGWLLGA
jgi:hypothetical protein